MPRRIINCYLDLVLSVWLLLVFTHLDFCFIDPELEIFFIVLMMVLLFHYAVAYALLDV